MSNSLSEIIERIVYPMVGPRCATNEKKEEQRLGEPCIVCATYEGADQSLADIKAWVAEALPGQEAMKYISSAVEYDHLVRKNLGLEDLESIG